MNNIVKYALPGTRVYLRLQESDGIFYICGKIGKYYYE